MKTIKLLIIMLLFNTITFGQLYYIGVDMSFVLKDVRFENARTGVADNGDIYYYIPRGKHITAFYTKKNNIVYTIKYIGYSMETVREYLDDIESDGAYFTGKYYVYKDFNIYVHKNVSGDYTFQYTKPKLKSNVE